ncbi:MAG: CopG family ribbon-helix-helix protein [Burkholderiales bacterium]|nr:CopG family ribbon-helix-helix protein [Burkholderiales bacterium]
MKAANSAIQPTPIPQATISAAENGWVSLGAERAKAFARALHCHPAVLDFPGREMPLIAPGRATMYTSPYIWMLPMSTTMTIRIEDEVKERLDRLAESTNRSRSYLAAEAIRAFVETNEWQVAEIRQAITEADAGDFASDKDVAALARKWKVNAP